MTRSSRDLAARIWSAFPVTQQAFAKLLGLLDIEATPTVPTACVTFGARSRMLLNPAFVAAHCRNDHELVMLVLHELHHVALGHTRLFQRATPLENFAFDCVINAHLCQLFDDFQGASLFRRTYRADVVSRGAAAAARGLAHAGRALGDAGPRGRCSSRALQRCADVVPRGAAAVPDVAAHATARTATTGRGRALARVTLLGNHAGDHHDPGRHRGRGAQRDGRWPMVEDARDATRARRPSSGRSMPRRRGVRAVRTIREAILAVAQRGAGEAHGGRSAPTVESVLPFRSRTDRRAEWRVAMGVAPLMWHASLASPARDTAERVHVYLDVSGSMDDALPLLYATLASLLGLLHPEVHLFSTAHRRT